MKYCIPTDTAQRVDENNGAICLVIVFTPRVMVIINVANVPCFIFSADNRKKLDTDWQNIYVHLEVFVELFKKMVWLTGFGVIMVREARLETEKLVSQHKIPKSCIIQEF